MGNGFAALSLMVLAGLGMRVNAQAGPPGEKIQFSAPSNPAIASNLNRLDPHQNTFKQVQDDLFKPFKLGNQFYNRDGITSPPPPSQVMPDMRTLDLIEKRKNWAFADWNDLFPDPSMEESSKDEMDGKGKKPLSLIEKYYENLNQKQTSTNRWNINGRLGQDFAGTNTFDPNGETFSAEGQFNKIMKHILNPANTDGKDKSVVDFNHSTFRTPSAEEVQDQKRRFEEFQQLLDPHRVAPLAPMNPGSQGQINGNNPADQFASTPPHRAAINPAMGVTDPTAKAFYSHAYDDPTALALGQTNNLLTPRPLPPLLPPPKLQPFDNLSKRKF